MSGTMDKFAERVDKAFMDAGFSGGWKPPEAKGWDYYPWSNELAKYAGWAIEELIMGTNINVGDEVYAPRHGRGTVLAISGDDAWVQTEGKDYPLTFDIRKLKLAPKPRVGILGVVQERNPWGGTKTAEINWNVEAVELTPEVRERLKDLL